MTDIPRITETDKQFTHLLHNVEIAKNTLYEEQKKLSDAMIAASPLNVGDVIRERKSQTNYRIRFVEVFCNRLIYKGSVKLKGGEWSKHSQRIYMWSYEDWEKVETP